MGSLSFIPWKFSKFLTTPFSQWAACLCSKLISYLVYRGKFFNTYIHGICNAGKLLGFNGGKVFGFTEFIDFTFWHTGIICQDPGVITKRIMWYLKWTAFAGKNFFKNFLGFFPLLLQENLMASFFMRPSGTWNFPVLSVIIQCIRSVSQQYISVRLQKFVILWYVFDFHGWIFSYQIYYFSILTSLKT